MATITPSKDIAISIPLGRLVCPTGVSGSGSSTLMRDVLERRRIKMVIELAKAKPGNRLASLRFCCEFSDTAFLHRLKQTKPSEPNRKTRCR